MEDNIRRRMYILEQTFIRYTEQSKADGIGGFSVNLSMLREVVVSYFHDIERLKQFHKISYADKFKQAAYTIKWIMRLRPFGFDCPDNQVQESHWIINETIAWWAAFTFLEIVPEDVPEQLFQLMLYTCRYRPLDEDALLLVCQALEISATKQRELSACRAQLEHWREKAN